MFTSITLSTGTTIKIPIFDAFTGIESKTRANGVLRDYDMSGHLKFSKITDEELIELHNIIYNGTATTITINREQLSGGSIYDGHWVFFLFWYYDSVDNRYNLASSFSGSSQSNCVVLLNLVGDSHYTSVFFNYRYYKSYNADGYVDDLGTHYTNYFDAVAYWKANEIYKIRPLINVRPGYIYSLDFCYWNNTERELCHFLNVATPTESTIYSNISDYEEATHTQVDITDQSQTYTDPYGNIISEPGGYDGDISIDPEAVEKGEIPDLPTLSAVDAGMITMYYCTNAQLQALANYLWTNIYDLETNFVKLFANPMDCIIGLGIVPVTPSLGSAAAVHFGNISTSVYMTKLASQFVEYDLGSVAVPKWLGCFMDYSPYVKLSLYLPYIGYRDLSADDVVGDTIHVVYHIDCLTGGCCAFVETAKKGLLYTFNGSCIANVPLTATNYSTAIQNAVSAVGAGLTTVAGIATGAAPIAAAGVAAGLSNAANTAINSKPQIQRSGAMGGAAGLMSCQRPQLIIERPRMCVPNTLNHFVGNTLYVTRRLGNIQGFTQIDLINLENIPCTADERKELEAILNGGVYF